MKKEFFLITMLYHFLASASNNITDMSSAPEDRGKFMQPIKNIMPEDTFSIDNERLQIYNKAHIEPNQAKRTKCRFIHEQRTDADMLKNEPEYNQEEKNLWMCKLIGGAGRILSSL